MNELPDWLQKKIDNDSITEQDYLDALSELKELREGRRKCLDTIHKIDKHQKELGESWKGDSCDSCCYDNKTIDTLETIRDVLRGKKPIEDLDFKDMQLEPEITKELVSILLNHFYSPAEEVPRAIIEHYEKKHRNDE